MAELKTKPNAASVEAFIGAVADEDRRRDCRSVMKLMKQATGARPIMWGTSIVGYGDYRYKYASGREGDWFLTGFSPRKRELTLYLMGGLKQHASLLGKLGKHKVGGGCLYIRSFDDVDLGVLERLIVACVRGLRQAEAPRKKSPAKKRSAR